MSARTAFIDEYHHCMSPALEKPPGPWRQEHIANGVYCIYQDRMGLTKSIIPLFVTFGNKHPTRYPASCFPSHVFGPGDSIIFGQIECDSQNPTRSRLRSSHFLSTASPTTPSDVSTGTDESEDVGCANRNLFEISMFGRNSSGCHDDPCDGVRLRPKNRIPEFRCFQEVDRSRVSVTY